MTTTEVLARIRRAIALHEPLIDFEYEEVTCKCGWDGEKRPRDSYMAHVRTAILRAAADVPTPRGAHEAMPSAGVLMA